MFTRTSLRFVVLLAAGLLNDGTVVSLGQARVGGGKDRFVRMVTTTCPPGKYLNSTGIDEPGICFECPGGSYCSGGSNQAPSGLCSAGYYCPRGSTSGTPTGNACSPGYSCPAGSASPIACLGGTYQDKGEQISCKSCPPSYYCPNGTDLPSPCQAGYFCSGGTADQMPCPVGYFCSGWNEKPVPCPNGTNGLFTKLEASDQCISCPSGSYCQPGATSIQSCPKGHYCPAGSVRPIVCDNGTYQDTANQSYCYICPPSFYCNSSSAILCPDGYYCPSGVMNPLPCPGGYFCRDGSFIGEKNLTDSTGGPCPPGSYCPKGSALPIECPDGSFCSGWSTDPSPCLAGYYCYGQLAYPLICPATYYCPYGSVYPVPCPEGYYCNQQSSYPSTCPSGFYCPFMSGFPVQCPNGTYSSSTKLTSSIQCIRCSTGENCTQGSVYDPSCSSAVSGDCQPCYPGYYCNHGGDLSVEGCPQGYIKNLCPANYWVPVPCSSKNILSALVAWKCFSCNSGMYCDCILGNCPVGWISIVVCPAGHYCSGGNAAAIACPVGTYNPIIGQMSLTDCLPCPNEAYCNSPGQVAWKGISTNATITLATDPRQRTRGFNISLCQVCSSSSTEVAKGTTVAPTFLENELKNVLQANITPNIANNVSTMLQAMTTDADSLTPLAVMYLSSIVNKLADIISSGNFTSDLYPVPRTIARIVGNLMNVNDTLLALASDKTQVSLQASLERSLYALAEAAGQPESPINDSFLSLQEQNLAFQVVRDSTVLGLTISGGSSLREASINPVFSNETSASTYKILSNATVVKLSQVVQNSTKTFLVYSNSKLFQTNASINADTNTRVLSAQISKYINRKIPGLVSVTFTGLSAPPSGLARQCGYWNYAADNWLTDGCTATITSNNQVDCVCDHLTNFAALLAISDLATNPELDILTTVGLSLSIVSLAAVVATFVFFSKMRRTVSQKVLFNLALSLMVLDLLFLLDIKSTHSTGGCVAVAALIHYFLLTSFAWMLVESILQYLRFVKVLGTYIPRFMRKTAIPAWGVPAVVVASICGINLDLYKQSHHSYCLAQQVVVYYAILLPIGLILIVNWIIFAIVLKHFCCHHGIANSNKGSESRLARLHAQAGVAISTVLGLTWVIGFLTAVPDAATSVAFQWLFCLCNTLQGFLICVFHCLREPSVLKEWKRLCCSTNPSTQRSGMSYSEESTTAGYSTSSTRQPVRDELSDSSVSIQLSTYLPSHQGSYELSSTSKKKVFH